MIGTYRFYENGELIGEVNNLITSAGKTQILKYLAGYGVSIGRGIAVGLGDTAAQLTDTSLKFEFSRSSVNLISADYADNSIVFKGTVGSDVVGTIYEVGLWSEYQSQDFFTSRTLLKFGSTEGSWDAGEWFSTSTRMGVDSMRLAPALSATIKSTLVGAYLDLSGYSDLDEFLLAYNVNSAFVANVKLYFYTDISNYYTQTITSPAAGYHIDNFSKPAFIATGTPNWSNITSVAVSVTSTAGGSGSVDFDALRIEDRDLNDERYVLVSRAVPSTPIIKTSGLEMEFEYVVGLAI